jgi:DNA-binding response OmpR family regulator
VVDDNDAAARSIEVLLKRRGHTTHVVGTGADALDAVRSFNPDTVLLDIGLPDMDGFEVASKIKELAEPPRLIALTGYGQQDDRAKGRDVGFDAYLTKPVSITDIEAAL